MTESTKQDNMSSGLLMDKFIKKVLYIIHIIMEVKC